MPLSLICPACGTRLQAPDEAAGRRVKCSRCAHVWEAQRPVLEAEEVVEDRAQPDISDLLDDLDKPRSSHATATPSEPPRRPCPFCGELIVASAAKCRFCNAVFDAALQRTEERKKVPDVDRDMTTGDWVVAVLCSGIGCIVGIVWLIQGKPKAGKMIGVSLLFAFLWNILKVVIQSAMRPMP